MRLHNRGTQMDTTSLISRTTHVLAVFVLGMASANLQAEPAYATVIDNLCNTATYGNVKPVTNYATYGVSRCNICHNANNRSISLSPEWPWYNSGPSFTDRENFCVVQGIIETPASDMTLSRGATVNLKARGFSPKGKTSQLTYTWTFSDGRAPIVLTPTNQVASVSNVPLPNSGNTLTITLSTTGALDTTSDSETRVITISDDPVSVDNDSYTVQSGHTLSVSSSTGVLQGDSGVGTLKATLVSTVSHGSLLLNPNGSFSYTPTLGYVGSDTFTYTASNGVLTSAVATVTIDVTSLPPVANADSYSTAKNVTLTVSNPGVLSNDTGSGTLTAVLGTTHVTHGTLNLNGNGGFSYTPTAGFTGTDSFSYVVNNGSVDSAPATVTIDVGACTDKDNDGYSPEGGRCGPQDCNDKQATMSPGLKEICTNKIDDDCNGVADNSDPACPLYTPTNDAPADCIGAKLNNQVRIDSANWSADQLTVKGSKATVGATVTVYKLDPVTQAATVLGSTTVVPSPNATWTYTYPVVGSANAPCRVKAVINGATGVRAVTGSTANCSSNNGAPAACSQ